MATPGQPTQKDLDRNKLREQLIKQRRATILQRRRTHRANADRRAAESARNRNFRIDKAVQSGNLSDPEAKLLAMFQGKGAGGVLPDEARALVNKGSGVTPIFNRAAIPGNAVPGTPKLNIPFPMKEAPTVSQIPTDMPNLPDTSNSENTSGLRDRFTAAIKARDERSKGFQERNAVRAKADKFASDSERRGLTPQETTARNQSNLDRTSKENINKLDNQTKVDVAKQNVIALRDQGATAADLTGKSNLEKQRLILQGTTDAINAQAEANRRENQQKFDLSQKTIDKANERANGGEGKNSGVFVSDPATGLNSVDPNTGQNVIRPEIKSTVDAFSTQIDFMSDGITGQGLFDITGGNNSFGVIMKSLKQFKANHSKQQYDFVKQSIINDFVRNANKFNSSATLGDFEANGSLGSTVTLKEFFRRAVDAIGNDDFAELEHLARIATT